MKLAVILPTLAGGGMERMRLHLIEEWISSGIEVDLLVSSCKGELVEMIPDKVKLFELSNTNPYFFPFKLYRYLKNENPTHILTCGHDINAITLFMVWLLRNPIPVVGSFNNHLSSELLLSKGFKKIKLIASILLLRLFLSKSQGIISVSQGVADDLKSYLGFKYNNIFHVVYNPVITSDTFEKINQPLRSLPVPKNVQWILYAGRLVHAKGLDLLVKAFRLISNKTNAHLIIMGNGPLQSEITCIAKEAGLEDRIHLVGFQTNALPWMRAADVFVLPSRHEGLPNVLIEALACGTQIVANDCPSGPAEILDNGKYGQLVPVENPKALGQALLLSLSGAFQVAAQELQKRANYFSAEKAARIYLAVLKNEQQKF